MPRSCGSGRRRGARADAFATRYAGHTLEVVTRSDGARGFLPLPKRWTVERTFGWSAASSALGMKWLSNPRNLRPDLVFLIRVNVCGGPIAYYCSYLGCPPADFCRWYPGFTHPGDRQGVAA